MNEKQTLGFQYFRYGRKVQYPVRLQHEYVFVYSLQGQVEVTESANKSLLADGEILAGNSQRWRSSAYGLDGGCEGLTLIVSPKLLPDMKVFGAKQQAKELRRVVEEVLIEMRTQSAGWQELLDALAHEMLVRIKRTFTAQDRPENASNQRLLSRRHYVGALSFMQSCAKNDFSVDRLSHEIGMSGADFSRLYHLSTGRTPLQVYNELLISRAEEALREAESVKEVAYQFGFQSPSHFTALYRKIKGHLPSELRLSKN